MRTLIVATITYLCSSSLLAATLAIQNMRARKVPPGMTMTAVYGELKNTSAKPLTLVRLDSSVAGQASLHETVEEGGLSRMKPLAKLTLKPGERVALVPGGKHIMLEKLKEGWSASDRLTLRLTYDDGSTQDVTVQIQENP